MVVAVNTRFLFRTGLEGIGYFTKEVFFRMAAANPQHRFLFIFDRPHPEMDFPPNVIPVVAGPPARHPLLWKAWFDLVIPRILKKHKADVFVSPDGFCSMHTSVPQCLVVHDLGFLHQPSAYQRSHLLYLKHYVPRFIKKSAAIATVSEFSKADIIKQYGTDPSKISVVYSAVKDVFHPVEADQKELVKEKFTAGREYFLYLGAIQPRKNLVNLLKAFSVFKKRLQSEMKLVLCGRLAWKNNEFLELLKNYKYRQDVVLTGYLPEQEVVELTAAAYALVYPSLFEGFGVPVLEGMKSRVPVLTSEGTSMQEIGGDGAIYFNPDDPKDIGEKMMLIYKDESLKRRLVEKGKEIEAQFTWDRTAALLWEQVLKAAGESHR